MFGNREILRGITFVLPHIICLLQIGNHDIRSAVRDQRVLTNYMKMDLKPFLHALYINSFLKFSSFAK